jgi:hypothetical protein
MTSESPPYVLDVVYQRPLGTGIDEDLESQIVSAVGQRSGSSGQGAGGRDMQFYFDSADDRAAAAERITAAGLSGVSVVRRTDQDPAEPHGDRLLTLQTLDEEIEFLSLLDELWNKPEHRATIRLVLAKFRGQTVEEFDECQQKVADMMKALSNDD